GALVNGGAAGTARRRGMIGFTARSPSSERGDPLPYFERIGDSTFQPTCHVGGAWNPAEQHIAPALGLLAHEVELDRDARGRSHLFPARLSYDIWGPVPLETVQTAVRLHRPGRTVELVEAELVHAGRKIATL